MTLGRVIAIDTDEIPEADAPWWAVLFVAYVIGLASWLAATGVIVAVVFVWGA